MVFTPKSRYANVWAIAKTLNKPRSALKGVVWDNQRPILQRSFRIDADGIQMQYSRTVRLMSVVAGELVVGFHLLNGVGEGGIGVDKAEACVCLSPIR